MRHGLAKALGTFHLSCGEYAILPLDWIAILGLRFEGEPVLTEFMGIVEECTPLGIDYPYIVATSRFFRPTQKPKICLLQLKMIIPWKKELDYVAFRRFFFFFIGSCLFGNNRSVLTCRLLAAIRIVCNIGAYD